MFDELLVNVSLLPHLWNKPFRHGAEILTGPQSTHYVTGRKLLHIQVHFFGKLSHLCSNFAFPWKETRATIKCIVKLFKNALCPRNCSSLLQQVVTRCFVSNVCKLVFGGSLGPYRGYCRPVSYHRKWSRILRFSLSSLSLQSLDYPTTPVLHEYKVHLSSSQYKQSPHGKKSYI